MFEKTVKLGRKCYINLFYFLVRRCTVLTATHCLLHDTVGLAIQWTNTNPTLYRDLVVPE